MYTQYGKVQMDTAFVHSHIVVCILHSAPPPQICVSSEFPRVEVCTPIMDIVPNVDKYVNCLDSNCKMKNGPRLCLI